MSQFDYEVACEKLPPAIDQFEEVWVKKLGATGDLGIEIANATGAPAFIKDAQNWKEITETAMDYVKRICGEEGDKGTESGSARGLVTTGKKMRTAMGGDM